MDWLFKALGYIGASLGIALVNKVLLSRKTPNREILGITLILTATMMILDYFDMTQIRDGLDEGLGFAMGNQLTTGTGTGTGTGQSQFGGMDDPVAINYWTSADAHGLPMDTCDRKDFKAGYPLKPQQEHLQINEPEEIPNTGGQGRVRRMDELDSLFLHGGRADQPDQQSPVDGQKGGSDCLCGFAHSNLSTRANVPADLTSLELANPGGVAIGKYVRSNVPVVLKNNRDQLLVARDTNVEWATFEGLEREPLFRLRFLTRLPHGSPIRNNSEVYLVWTDNNGEIKYIGADGDSSFQCSTVSNSDYLWSVKTRDNELELVEYGDVVKLVSQKGKELQVKVEALRGCGPVYRMTS